MPHPKTLKVLNRLSMLVFAIGFALMVMMIVVESEPGALPLALELLGIGGFFYTRARIRSQETTPTRT